MSGHTFERNKGLKQAVICVAALCVACTALTEQAEPPQPFENPDWALDRDNLPCPACQGSMISLNEKEILFLNPGVSHAGGFNLWARRNMTLRLSDDDGRTWPHSLLLSEGLSGYSDMAVTKEGKILCAFENGKQDYCQKMSVVQVDRATLVAGKDAPAEKGPGKP